MSTPNLEKAISAVPLINALGGVSVVSATPGAVSLALNAGPAIQNHAGQAHTAALFALGELAAGVVLQTHPELAGLQQLQRASGIRYLRPCATPPTAIANVTEPVLTNIQDSIARDGQAKVEMIVSLVDGTDTEVAEVVAVFSIKRP